MDQAIQFEWKQIPNALGLHAGIFGMQGQNTLILWTSSEVYNDAAMGDWGYLQMAEVRDRVAANVMMKGDRPSVTVPAGIFKDWSAANPVSPYKTLVDGWDIEHLTGPSDVNTVDRNGYFYKIFVNVWTKLCQVQGTPLVTLDVPKQDTMTKDNVPMAVDAVVYFQVVDPAAAITRVESFVRATAMIAQTNLRSTIGQSEMDDLLARREDINARLQTQLDEQTEPWGIKVTTVEVRDVVLPEGMRRAMARQAEVERERRAKIINAEGEFQAAARLLQAADTMAQNPITIQLRYLQTVAEVATENNSTTLFPLPIDLLRPFLSAATGEPYPQRPMPTPPPDDVTGLEDLENLPLTPRVTGGDAG
jgi:hypothetical protein